MLIIEEIAKEILRGSYEKRRGFIPSRIPRDIAPEIISGVKECLGGLPIRVGLAFKGGEVAGIWWAIRKK